MSVLNIASYRWRSGQFSLRYLLTKAAISVNRVNVRYCVFLWYSSSDQSVDFKVARCVEEHTEDVFAFTKKILRAPADDYARAASQCMIDGLFGNGGDSARIKQFQPIGWRQGPSNAPLRKDLKTR